MRCRVSFGLLVDLGFRVYGISGLGLRGCGFGVSGVRALEDCEMNT